MTLTFTSSLKIAAEAASQIIKRSKLDLRILRDNNGRLSFCCSGLRDDISADDISELRRVREALGAYSAGEDVVLTKDDIPNDQFFVEGWYETWITPDHADPFMVPVKDVTTWGRDWLWLESRAEEERAKRIVFHGLKGGVGRSTALAVLAQSLAKDGFRVLVVDLDVESPGANAVLLGRGLGPPYGVVDWLVEDAVAPGNAVIDDMVFESPLSAEEKGAILVAPAMGGSETEYVAKLGRIYLDVNGKRFADRVEAMLLALEAHHDPHIVLIDSRAGLHDVAASAVSRFADLSLLFFADTEQNWQGYRQLFELWKSKPDVLRVVREKVLSVRALGSDAKPFSDFLERSYELFQDSLYDELEPGEVSAAFSFDLNDQSAPHYPPIIHLHPRLHEGNLLLSPEKGGVSDSDIRIAFGSFIGRVVDAVGLERSE